MNSICKKFKKVISSVVLSCSMVCSCGFANAGLWGNKNVSEEYLDKFKCLGKEWCNEVAERGWNRWASYIDRINETTSPSGYRSLPEVYNQILDEDREIAVELVGKFVSGKISLDDLIEAGLEEAILPPSNKMDDLIEAGLKGFSELRRFNNFFLRRFNNFFLACWMMKYLESNGIRCALVCKSFTSGPCKISRLSKADSMFDRTYFGVAFFVECGKKIVAVVSIPSISMEHNSTDLRRILYVDLGSGLLCMNNTYVFVGQNDLKMLGLKGRNKRDFDLVTPESWVNVVDKIVKKDNNPGQYLKPIDDKLFDKLMDPKQKIKNQQNKDKMWPLSDSDDSDS